MTAEQAELPLISIICRSMGRPELKQSLVSVAAQSYPNLELILVNANGSDLSGVTADYRAPKLPEVNTGAKLQRAAAANAGLDAARGDYLLFLDEDDWIDPGHVQQLFDCLQAQTGVLAAYSNVQRTDRDGKALDYVFDLDFDPVLLMRDNYIPIHAVLFRRAALAAGCRFDEDFEVYEDWDFWMQLAQHSTFVHLDRVSAYYRAGGESETDASDTRSRYRADTLLGRSRAHLFDKWKQHWRGEAINQLLGSLDQSEALGELDQKLAAAYQRLEEEYRKSDELAGELKRQTHENQKQDAEIASLQQRLATLGAQLHERDQELARLDQVIQRIEAERADTEAHQRAHIQRLETHLNLIFGSFSWRLTKPLRAVRALLPGGRFWQQPQAPAVDVSPDPGPAQGPAAEPETPASREPEPDPAELSKQRQDELAKGELRAFLDSSAVLDFSCEAGPKLSVVLVLYNQAHLSYLCLRSLQQAGMKIQLVVLDNHSEDETGELLQRLQGATVIRNPDNLGFVKAVNQGAAAADGELLLLLNNDAMVEAGSLQTAVELMQRQGVGAVGARIRLLDGSLQEAGSIIWADGSCYGYGRGDDPELGEYMFERPVDYCSGAFLMFRRQDFERLGGFDEQFSPAYYEESDFCIRLRQQGLSILYHPDVVIAHYEFASSGGFSGASQLQQQHRKILCDKHREFLQQQVDSNSSDFGAVLRARIANRWRNVLVIDDRVPHPSLGAGYPRCAEIMRLLSSFELNVSFYPLQFPSDDWQQIYNTLPRNIEVLRERGRSGLLEFLQQRRDYYDLIIVSRIHNMEAVNALLQENPDLLGATRLVYDAEAVTAPREILRRRLLGEVLDEQFCEQLLRDEIEQARFAETIVTVSGQESKLYAEHGYGNTLVLGHTLDPAPGQQTFEERNGILFVGSLKDEGSPNVDSLHWFVDEILPLIVDRIPEIQFHVVGDYSAPSMSRIDQDNVVFHGRVDVIDDFYDQARIFIAPTRFAAGIPHKVHEAAAHGIPCVVTNLLARQLSWEHGQQLLSSETSREFAEQCLRLYQDTQLWQNVRERALEAVARDCSSSRFGSELMRLLEPQAD